MRRGDGSIDIRLMAGGDTRQHLAIAWIARFECPARDRISPIASDKKLEWLGSEELGHLGQNWCHHKRGELK